MQLYNIILQTHKDGKEIIKANLTQDEARDYLVSKAEGKEVRNMMVMTAGGMLMASGR